MPTYNALYFGCWGEIGHYLRDANRKHVWDDAGDLPWKQMDAVLCPGTTERNGHLRTPSNQTEGEALLHHREGWTALAFWDRSVDERGGCNSVFFLRGIHDFELAVTLAKQHFPSIWARFKFTVTQAQVEQRSFR